MIILFLNIIFRLWLPRRFSIARYTGVNIRVLSESIYCCYMHISFIRRFLLKEYIEDVSNLLVFQYQFGYGMSWFAILMTKSRIFPWHYYQPIVLYLLS